MTDTRAVALFLLGPWFSPSFWDDVDYEIETLDLDDFEEFKASRELPFEPRAEFRTDLGVRLRAFLATRYKR